MLVVQHRIRIRDSRRHQRPRVERRRRDDDLESGRAIEPRLGVLRVVRSGVPQPAPRHADDHRDRSAPAVPNLCRVVHELVEAGRDEIVELDLADRPKARQRRSDARAKHRAFGERRIQDPVAVFLEQRPQQQERVAVFAADVLAEHEDTRIGRERVADALHHRFEKRHALAVERWRGFDRERRRLEARAALPVEHVHARARRGVIGDDAEVTDAGSGHDASMTARASASTAASASCFRRSRSPSLSRPARVEFCGIRGNRIASGPVLIEPGSA